MTLGGIIFMSLGIVFFSVSFGFALFKISQRGPESSNLADVSQKATDQITNTQ